MREEGRTGEEGIKREGREGEAHETSQRLNFVSPKPQQPPEDSDEHVYKSWKRFQEQSFTITSLAKAMWKDLTDIRYILILVIHTPTYTHIHTHYFYLSQCSSWVPSLGLWWLGEEGEGEEEVGQWGPCD